MKRSIPAIPFAVLSAALLLTSCGKQEAVGDVPSSEELAKQADAATQAIRDEAAEENGQEGDAVAESVTMTSYANALRGFSIMVPEDWSQDEAASDDNGRLYKGTKKDVTLMVAWSENREDKDFAAATKAVRDAGDGMSGEEINANEYRASGSTSDGKKTSQRILRKADGSMVSATISYPEDQAERLDRLSSEIIASLTLQ